MELNKLDKIQIEDLLLRCIIGINPAERIHKQDVIINITLLADLKTACESDDIKDTVDYKHINKQVIEHVENSSYFLVEKLAAEIAQICLQPEMVKAVKVKVNKPGALRFTKSVGIELYRQKGD